MAKQKYTSAVDRGKALNARTEPGRGADAVDDGLPGKIHMKGIPNLSTGRLTRAVEFYHGQVHSQQGLRDFDMPRRSLIETGAKIRSTTHELKLRGQAPGDCKHCWGE